MKIVAICDSWEMCTSLRLVGIESIKLSVEEFSAEFNKIINDSEAAVVLVSKSFNFINKQNLPLIMEL